MKKSERETTPSKTPTTTQRPHTRLSARKFCTKLSTVIENIGTEDTRRQSTTRRTRRNNPNERDDDVQNIARVNPVDDNDGTQQTQDNDSDTTASSQRRKESHKPPSNHEHVSEISLLRQEM